ncbi:hypothetical protein P7C73_g1141, partial [Tremellales sp. Uapishka_1]
MNNDISVTGTAPSSSVPLSPIDSALAPALPVNPDISPSPVVDPTLSPPGTVRVARAASIASTSTAESLLGVNPKRQTEFERLFTEPLRREDAPADYLEVVATQSGDLQAKILLHGRLYLTRYHLCFRSNILGYVTENIHALKDITSVEKGTTAKWIQNAVYVVADGEQLGYGSLADRDALYETLVECWRTEAPERYEAMMDSIQGEALVETAHVETGEDETTEVDEAGGVTDVKQTKCSGEHFDELAIDTTFPLPLDQLFNLLYHNRDFLLEFYENDKGHTGKFSSDAPLMIDVVISDWEETEGKQQRSLTYDNSIGPSKSDCIGSETVVIADENSHEIVSETQTPDVPTGKKFKIRTRTCLTHTELNGKKATRMYCTTQCDWSASSWLKSTITPAVIKGQKEYHQELNRKIRSWVKVHPNEFGEVGDVEEDEVTVEEVKEGMVPETKGETTGAAVMTAPTSSIPEKSVLLGIIWFLVLVILYQFITSSRASGRVGGCKAEL